MAGLGPAIHVFGYPEPKTWMPGTRPGVTSAEVMMDFGFAGCSRAPE
jgi:hypothetical protein